jgi:hypothetical protein
MDPVCGAFRGRITAGRDGSGDPATSMQQSIKVAIHEMACSFVLTDFKARSLVSIYIISATPETLLPSNGEVS